MHDELDDERDFQQMARQAHDEHRTDEHGNSVIRFADGSYATFVEGHLWALWTNDVADAVAGEINASA